MATYPSAATLRSPRAPYGGRLIGTNGMQGANTQQYGNQNMAGAIGDNLMGLLGGKNMAADQADRTNLSAMAQMQKNQNAGAQRNAVQMGIQPGDPRYAAFQAKGQGDIQSMGSRLMGDAQQRRLDDQSKNLNTAISFNQGQQNFGLDKDRMGLDREKFGEDTRQFNQKFGALEKDTEIGNLWDIINSPLSSEGQVEAAKQRLVAAQGNLDGGLWNTAEKTQAQRSFDEIKNQLSVMNPGMSPEELDAMARERFSQIDKAGYESLVKANESEFAGKKKDDKYSMGLGTDDALGDALNIASGGVVSDLKGLGHGGAEIGRGFRDIGRGDVIGGTGRVFAAPFKGAGHSIMSSGRTAKRTFRRLGNLF